jgi:PAS domain S-box-containing protein
MSLLANAPLRQKLTWLTTVCSIVALTTTGLALAAYEWYVYRGTAMSHLRTMSSIAARNSAAALAFDNQDDAARILSALEAEPAVIAAVLYDASGGRFAMYRRVGAVADLPAAAPPDGVMQTGSQIDLAVPVMEVKRFGTLLVRADLSAVTARLAVYGFVLLGTTLLSGVLAYLLTGRIAGRIVAPVQALVGAASGVQTNADYSVRVPKVEDDEIGALTDAFNAMLARVQQNEAELYRNAERLRLALESAKIGAWDWNMVRDEIVCNPRGCEILGVALGARLTPPLLFSRVHAEDRERVTSAIEEATANSAAFAVEFRLAQPDRSARYLVLRGRFLKSSAGDPLRAVGVVIDTTERRGAEIRVIESERRFRAMAERAPAMIWSCDPALNRDYVNKTWLAFTGRSAEQELGTGWEDGLPESDVERWVQTVRTAAAQLDPYQVEYRLRRADGAMRWIFETGSPRLAADGGFAGYLGSCIDITARKENEAELEAHVRLRTRELETANRELESFSYSVSHDLRGPVRAIQGFTEIALEECQAGNVDSAIERIHRVSKAADRMNKLIDAFISIARVSRAELTIEGVNLSRVAEETVGFLRATHPGRTVAVAIEPGLEAAGDERLLRIVLENLLGNAWKFTSRTAGARIEFGAVQTSGGRAFFVRDNGAGFNAAQAHKLFQPFERLHHPAQFDGVGVGLSTVHRALGKHNGRIWAESVEGEGATFYFTLPQGCTEEIRAKAAA